MKTFSDLFSITQPPLNKEDFQILEKDINVTIPPSIKKLYLINNGAYSGCSDSSYKIYYKEEWLGNLVLVYDIENVKNNFRVFKLCEKDGLGDFGTKRFIPFSDIGRAFICIGHTGDDLGKIFWIDTGNPIDEVNFPIFKLADSLEEFFDNLRPEEANG
jgi:hypothetical protein